MAETIFKNVCIVGAGAIGGWIGAGLARAGCAVSVLARGQTLAALQRDGLQLQSGPADALQTQSHKVNASASTQVLGPQDLVVVAVKAPAMREVARQIAPLLQADLVFSYQDTRMADRFAFPFLLAMCPPSPKNIPWADIKLAR